MRRRLTVRLVLWVIVIIAGSTYCVPAAANDDRFEKWLSGLRREALSEGISGAVLDETLRGLIPSARIIQLDRSQPEFTTSFEEYLKRVAPQARIDEGRARLAENRSLLEEISVRYGVQPQYLVALWSIESDFGRQMGNFSVVGSLVTLAYDGRRSKYFRGELLHALRMINDGHVQPQQMVGSWAGAMGQCQFMPSSFMRYAVDYDNDGRRDIWESRADVLASIANYLYQNGWHNGERWGQEVRLPSRFNKKLLGRKHCKTISEWQAVHLKPVDGEPFPPSIKRASLIRLGEKVFLVYDNWQTLMKWNPSAYFSTAVGYLADRIISQ
ncbi:MAG TPA: lytic murein transglycosylase [Thermodesulfovibrionales bacterium]|nr:lytic murein transglycosylase [Thermodesulfovibrionales bacterium]